MAPDPRSVHLITGTIKVQRQAHQWRLECGAEALKPDPVCRPRETCAGALLGDKQHRRRRAISGTPTASGRCGADRIYRPVVADAFQQIGSPFRFVQQQRTIIRGDGTAVKSGFDDPATQA